MYAELTQRLSSGSLLYQYLWAQHPAVFIADKMVEIQGSKTKVYGQLTREANILTRQLLFIEKRLYEEEGVTY